jgi:osmotically-inducible protein OsmY
MAQDWRERQQWRNEERRRMEQEENRRIRGSGYQEGRDFGRERYGEYEDNDEGRPYRGYEPGGFPGTGGFGYVPSPFPEQRRQGRDYNTPSVYRPGERDVGGYSGEYGREWSGRGYEEAYPRDRERGWWDRTKDEVKSWAGDEDAERRRRMDEANSHRGRGPKGYARSDDRIREDVNDRLTDDWIVDATNIEVTVASGDVTLAGTVDSRDAKRRAEDCAERVSGVRNVQNNLRVQQPTERTSAFEASGTTSGVSATASSRTNK